MTETTSTVTPFTFDVEAWLTDAALPEDSATVYKRPDVIAELSDLKRRIEIEGRINDPEVTASSKRPATLEAEYEAALRTFSGSALTIYVRAITGERLKAIRDEYVAGPGKAQDEDTRNTEIGYATLAESIVAVKPAGGTRQPAAFTSETVKAMRDAIGTPQMMLIAAARIRAQEALPSVDADFLHKRSGSETGTE